MKPVEWNPFRDMDYLARQMGSLMDMSPLRYFYGMNSPKVDIYQTERNLVLKAEIPGVEKEDLEVYVDQKAVRLAGHTKHSQELKDENLYKTERYHGSFSRTIALPEEVLSEQAKAEYKDGILTLTMPKVNPTKAMGKKIQVN